MIKVKQYGVLLSAIALVGCGGGSGSDSFPTHEVKEGYWEIQESTTNKTLYKGFITPSVFMLDQYNQSWDSTFGSNYESTKSSVSDIEYTLLGFGPSDHSQESEFITFPMLDSGIESKEITLGGQSVKLLFDPKYIHNTVNINPIDFSNLAWVDSENSDNTFMTSNDGTSFTIHTNKGYILDDCIFSGKIPTTTVNYAAIKATYNCTNDYGESASGTGYLTMATNSARDEMVIAIEAGTPDVRSHIILFR